MPCGVDVSVLDPIPGLIRRVVVRDGSESIFPRIGRLHVIPEFGAADFFHPTNFVEGDRHRTAINSGVSMVSNERFIALEKLR